MTQPLTAIPTTSLGRNGCGNSTLILLGFFGHFQNPYLNFTSVWWQVGRSMSRPSEQDPCPEHMRVTSCQPQPPPCSQSTLALCFSDSSFRSLSLAVYLLAQHSCAREMANADQTVHQLLKGGSSWGWGGGYGRASNK